MKKFLSFAFIFSGLIGTSSVGVSASSDEVKKEQTLDTKINSIKNKSEAKHHLSLVSEYVDELYSEIDEEDIEESVPSEEIEKEQTLNVKINSIKNAEKSQTTRKYLSLVNEYVSLLDYEVAYNVQN